MSSEAGSQETNAGTIPAAHIAGEPKVEPNAPKVEPNVPKVEPNVLEDAEGNNVHLLRMLRGDSTLTILEMAKELKVSRETIKRIIGKIEGGRIACARRRDARTLARA